MVSYFFPVAILGINFYNPFIEQLKVLLLLVAAAVFFFDKSWLQLVILQIKLSKPYIN